jgi:hypothetical protein
VSPAYFIGFIILPDKENGKGDWHLLESNFQTHARQKEE